jgi:hypothetical protein
MWLFIIKMINMRHFYRLKYQNDGVNENKMEIKSHPVPLGLKGRAGSNKINPLRFVCLSPALLLTFSRNL